MILGERAFLLPDGSFQMIDSKVSSDVCLQENVIGLYQQNRKLEIRAEKFHKT